ncbi:MAG TPA: carboxypeptidase regulatory-like domain-containing protein [Terracidiphilus sp.]|jgi:hypothetical protein|nr:carboxypeptidase regulatory-like domain-containing protein [Terracidiphilus sp.]
MTLRRINLPGLLLCLVMLGAHDLSGQSDSAKGVDVHVKIELPKTRPHAHAPPIVVWLKPLSDTPALPFLPDGHYTLLQKNRMFTPHLLVVPVGSEVHFPNADPFFHNVFSLFNGKRFDLGLYEAGTTKQVLFSREGVSYIFCNIHPEMSAVIVVLSTPLYATSGTDGTYSIRNVPPGDYEMNVWIEGLTQPSLSRLKRRVEVSATNTDLGVVDARDSALQSDRHLNKFGQPYDEDSKPTY